MTKGFWVIAVIFELVEIERKACLVLDCRVMLVLIANLSSYLTFLSRIHHKVEIAYKRFVDSGPLSRIPRGNINHDKVLWQVPSFLFFDIIFTQSCF